MHLFSHALGIAL